MTSRYQRARRFAFWRGAGIALFLFSSWIAVSGLAGAITS